MKKVILILAAIAFVSTAKAQSKNNWDSVISKAKTATDMHFGNEAIRMIGKDTLKISEQIKFVKVGDKTVPTELLKKAMLILSQQDVDNFFIGIQEYPAKIANPFTQYFLKFFNLQFQEPKNK